MGWVAAPSGGRAVKADGEARSGVGCVEQQLAPHFIDDLAGDHQTQTLRLGGDLIRRIEPLVIAVPERHWEPVTALPHAQGVFCQAAVTLHRSDNHESNFLLRERKRS